MHHGAIIKKILKTRDALNLKIILGGECSGKTLSTTTAYYTRLYGITLFQNIFSSYYCFFTIFHAKTNSNDNNRQNIFKSTLV